MAPKLPSLLPLGLFPAVLCWWKHTTIYHGWWPACHSAVVDTV